MRIRDSSRRLFLRNALAGGGALATLGTGWAGFAGHARANPIAHRHYVFAYFGGGWDILLGLDPKDPAQFPPANLAEHRIQPAYEKLQGGAGGIVRAGGISFGPYIGELTRHAERMLLLRGVSMETVAHEAGFIRFATGRPASGTQAQGDSTSTWLASRLGANNLIPQVGMNVGVYNRTQPTYASPTQISSSYDLVRLLRPAGGADAAQSALLSEFMEREARCERSRHSPAITGAASSRQRLEELLEADVAAFFDLDRAELAALRDAFAVPGGDYASGGAQALITYQLLTQGVSRCVTFSATGGLDTHYTDWAQFHGPRQQAGFQAVARLVDQLAATPYADVPGTSWLDHTTIIGFSEFSRTAMLNASGGRDHSLTNSIFMIGGNTRPGLIGASSDVGMGPSPIDFATGQLSSTGTIIKPEHLLRAIMIDAGIEEDVANLRTEPLSIIMRS